MKNLVKFGGILLLLESGWFDITEDLSDGTPPTLAKPKGVGVLQVSIARYAGGKLPGLSVGDLKRLLEELRTSKGYPASREVCVSEGDISCVGTVFSSTKDSIHVWYLTDGRSVVLITYLSESPDAALVAEEVEACETMVRTVRFPAYEGDA